MNALAERYVSDRSLRNCGAGLRDVTLTTQGDLDCPSRQLWTEPQALGLIVPILVGDERGLLLRAFLLCVFLVLFNLESGLKSVEGLSRPLVGKHAMVDFRGAQSIQAWEVGLLFNCSGVGAHWWLFGRKLVLLLFAGFHSEGEADDSGDMRCGCCVVPTVRVLYFFGLVRLYVACSFLRDD